MPDRSATAGSVMEPYNDSPQALQAEFDRAGSTNVPMDSWIYPALDRLAALGLIPTQSISIRPWTRRECLRQVREASDHATREGALNASGGAEADRLIDDLDRELSSEESASGTATLESAYVRFGTIAGPALADSYHFGQTWWNDFGRPLGRGSSFIVGFSARANSGRFFLYAREEAQHSPGNPVQSPAVVQLINSIDTQGVPNEPVIAGIPARSAYQRYRPIELYAGATFWGNAFSFGKQELYWGPTVSGPLSFSSNAEPTWNLRFVSTRPHSFPGFLEPFGTFRFDVVAGKLSGHHYPARPLFNGGKLSLNFGENVEISITRWSLLCGVGHPCNLHAFIENLRSSQSTGLNGGGGSGGYGDPTDPGDRKSGFDFRFKPPGLRKIVTLYSDSYADDEVMPLETPNRSAFSPGIYFARLPFLPQVDLRVESNSTNRYSGDKFLGGYLLFWNNQYLDANTNKGFLLGNAVGRDGRAVEGHLGYWTSARSRAEIMYRQNKGGPHFLPGGSTITDVSYKESFALGKDWTAEVFAQYERFFIPPISPGPQHNSSGWFQIMWNPQLRVSRKK
ncbi:capsule assembly Wzi family protein [Granulicella sibirica]|uniref:capsule assembly Wzi family protein n=1 Tax=Granulicella sibirica TaxID=2479048 RepID=UPI0013759F7C|nr:capsule assembly Wzi family protein [Granulicella sibirica]